MTYDSKIDVYFCSYASLFGYQAFSYICVLIDIL